MRNTIVHIILDCFYREGYGYQENIITAKHKQLGYNVHIVTYNQRGDISQTGHEGPCRYTNVDGIPVHVLANKVSSLSKLPFIAGWTDKTIGLYEKLCELSPDIIFVHNICMHDHIHIIKYKKQHPEVLLFADSHSDYYNSPIATFGAKAFRYGIGRYMGRLFGKYAEKVWGVTPWRVDYLENVYHVPSHKTGLLVMGGDDDKIQWDKAGEIRTAIRVQYGIPNDAFLIVSGGRIDKTKNIHQLIEAVKSIGRPDVHLLFFGSIEADMKAYMEQLKSPIIHYAGWIKADKSYDFFLASDLACFPGTHSVLWEQACACGLPAIFKDWKGGFSHIDLGGNCELLDEITQNSIKIMLLRFIEDKEFYQHHHEIAVQKGLQTFSYIEIAKRAIGL